MTTVYVPRVQFMSQSRVYVQSTVLCPKSTVYVPMTTVYTVQFSHDYSLCPKSTVYFPRVQFISHDYSLCP